MLIAECRGREKKEKKKWECYRVITATESRIDTRESRHAAEILDRSPERKETIHREYRGLSFVSGSSRLVIINGAGSANNPALHVLLLTNLAHCRSMRGFDESNLVEDSGMIPIRPRLIQDRIFF